MLALIHLHSLQQLPNVLDDIVPVRILLEHKAQVQASSIRGAKLVSRLAKVVLAGFVAAGSRDYFKGIEMRPLCTPFLPEGLHSIQKITLGHLVIPVFWREQVLQAHTIPTGKAI